MGFFQKIFGSYSDRELKKINVLVDAIEALDAEYAALSDAELQGKTAHFKARLENGETLDDILVEAFATVREAAWRVLGLKAFRVQLIGGIVLHQGRIAEMKTGEGKTLVATLPSYLNALTGRGVHVVTVNEYLAKYQGELMGRVHRFLGLSVGILLNEQNAQERRAAYDSDITYGTNNEFGFDYLRDNMALYKNEMVQRDHHVFAIVDEVDSILIDEARTPLIISGQGEKPTEIYARADACVAKMKCTRVTSLDAKEDHDKIEADYIVDEKARRATLTASGVAKVEEFFGIENLADPSNATLHHHINQAIHARGVMHRDVNYVVREGQIIIVDEFTGRLMPGRRYSEGLHQAIEAKERVNIQRESKTLATITLQNYFRLYEKLSGMTGTALTEEEEFKEIYSLDVVEIPTNRPMIRTDHHDVLYKSEAVKFSAVLRQIEECVSRGQPVLVGTVSIEKSEALSARLGKIPHVVLNAKNHEKEAEIVAQAGKLGAVTIATNMAGRGTDIMLGGNPDFLAKSDLRKAGLDEELIIDAAGSAPTDDPAVLEARAQYRELYAKHKAETDAEAEKVRAAGGLFIIGTERHESRRIDNQLRGRAGRQGDPGASRFYISAEDDLIHRFAGKKFEAIFKTIDPGEEPLEAAMFTKTVETAQKTVESQNFAVRKHVLQYDDVMNKQREIIYTQRKQVLDDQDVSASVKSMITSSIADAVAEVMDGEQYVQVEHLAALRERYVGVFLSPNELTYTAEQLNEWDLDAQALAEEIDEFAQTAYLMRESRITPPVMRELERYVLLRTVDEHWMNHIDAMHELRQAIGLSAYAQHNPVEEYKNTGFVMFEEMIASIRDQVARMVMTFEVQSPEAIQRRAVAKITGTNAGDQPQKKQPVRKEKKVGRNDPCPCGSGLKYKKCCGRNESN